MIRLARLLAGSLVLVALAPAAAQSLLWGRQFGTSAEDVAGALAPDGAAGAFVAGETGGSLFGPYAGSGDAFLARYDGAGNLLWGRQFGTSASDGASALAPDGAGGALLAGGTWGDLFGVNPGPADTADAWIARYGDACYADCDGDGALTLADFGCFQTDFAIGNLQSDCNRDGSLNLADFGCFQTKFAVGCP